MLRKYRPETAAPIFLFTDPGRDTDDLIVLVAAKYLQKHGFVDLRAVVTTLGDLNTRTKRAKFAKSVLHRLGLKRTPVGVGTDYDCQMHDATGVADWEVTERRRQDHQVFVETPLLDMRSAVEMDGLALVERELRRVPDHSAVFLVNAGMTDVAAVLETAPDLMRRKTSKVVIMGGVDPALDQRGFVVADKRAYNNTTDQPSAAKVYLRFQELGRPIVVITKEAAYAAAVSPHFYDELAATGHPIGVFVEEQQRLSLQRLWYGIHAGQLSSDLTPEWFFTTFTDIDLNSSTGQSTLRGANANADDFPAVWKLVRRLNLYDVLALLAASPGVSELVFRPATAALPEPYVRVVDSRAVADTAFLKDLITALAIESLME